jgi:dihydroorotase
VVDAGGSGWRDFHRFKSQIIDRSETRVLAFLNIVGAGMKGGPVEQDLTDMDARLTAQRAKEFPGLVVGVKVAHYTGPEWDPVDRAVRAGELAGIPVMIDFGRHVPPLSLEQLLLTHLRPGDVFTHTYAEVSERMPVVDEKGQVRPYVFEAQKRGVIFDVGHGAGSFVFRQAVPAVEQGLIPDTISTDLHTSSMNAGMKDLLTVMSKFLNMGMSIADVIRKTTWKPASVIQRTDLGHLSPGALADVALLRLREGNFGFIDTDGFRMPATRKLECELVLREGRVVWDLNGRASTDWRESSR